MLKISSRRNLRVVSKVGRIGYGGIMTIDYWRTTYIKLKVLHNTQDELIRVNIYTSLTISIIRYIKSF